MASSRLPFATGSRFGNRFPTFPGTGSPRPIGSWREPLAREPVAVKPIWTKFGNQFPNTITHCVMALPLARRKA